MKKKWTLLDEYKQSLKIYTYFTPIVSVVFIVIGIVMGSFNIIGVGVAVAIITVGCIIYIKKKIKCLEAEEKTEAARIEYLENEVMRLKTEQEKGHPKTIDANDRNDEI